MGVVLLCMELRERFWLLIRSLIVLGVVFSGLTIGGIMFVETGMNSETMYNNNGGVFVSEDDVEKYSVFEFERTTGVGWLDVASDEDVVVKTDDLGDDVTRELYVAASDDSSVDVETVSGVGEVETGAYLLVVSEEEQVVYHFERSDTYETEYNNYLFMGVLLLISMCCFWLLLDVVNYGVIGTWNKYMES